MDTVQGYLDLIMARLGVLFCPTLMPVQHQHHSQLSGNLDLILARLCRESLLVQVVKVGVQQRSLGRDPLAGVVHQHFHQQIIPGTHFEGGEKESYPVASIAFIVEARLKVFHMGKVS